jgi:hypothetical protein
MHAYREADLQTDAIFLLTWRAEKRVNPPKSRDNFLHNHNTFSSILHSSCEKVSAQSHYLVQD